MPRASVLVAPLASCLCLGSGCASIAIVQDAAPVPRGTVRGGPGVSGYLESADRIGGYVVPHVDARFGLGEGFDIGARISPLEVALDVKGLVRDREGLAVSALGGIAVGADPAQVLSSQRSVFATARGAAIVRARAGAVSVYGGPQVTFGPTFSGGELEQAWLLFRGGGFLGLAVVPGHRKNPDLALFFEVQAGGMVWQPVGDAGARDGEAGVYVSPAAAFAWNWVSPGGIW